MKKSKGAGAFLLLGTVGTLIGFWAFAAMIGGLYKVGWDVTEFVRYGLVASGLVQPIHTLVDYYTHIKGIEYIICVVFFVVFPLFLRYVDQGEKQDLRMVLRNKDNQDNFS